MIQQRSVAIVGTGRVGIVAAFAMFMRQTASEILLVDEDTPKTEGHAMDLMHGKAPARIAARAKPVRDPQRSSCR
jgi:L-lactate dehydrogenase